jgi:hypothetical protein
MRDLVHTTDDEAPARDDVRPLSPGVDPAGMAGALLQTRADATGGLQLEAWAARYGTATVDVVAEEQLRAVRATGCEMQRRFFRGFADAAKSAERSALRAVRRLTGRANVAAQETSMRRRSAQRRPSSSRSPAGFRGPRVRRQGWSGAPARQRDLGSSEHSVHIEAMRSLCDSLLA